MTRFSNTPSAYSRSIPVRYAGAALALALLTSPAAGADGLLLSVGTLDGSVTAAAEDSGERAAPLSIPREPPEEDLLTIYRHALEADRQLAAARSRRRVAEEDIPQARALYLPQIGVSGGYERREQDISDISETLEHSGWDATLSLTQPIFRREALIRMEQARTLVSTAELELSLAGQQLALRVADAYFDVLLAQDEMALVDAELAAVESQLRRAERALEVGTGTQTDVDEARAVFDRVRAQRVAVTNQLDVAREALRRITGRYPGSLASLEEGVELRPVEPADPDHWVEMAEQYNLEVQLAERRDRLARQEVDASRADRWPDLDLEARLTRFDGTEDRLGPTGVTSSDGAIDTRSIRLQISVPLYTGGAISSRTRAAEAERTATSDELFDQRREGALAARSSFLNLAANRERIAALEQALVSARSNEASVRRGQEVGLRTTTDVLDAQSRRFQTKRDLAEARYGYLLNFLELQAAVGIVLDEAVIEDVNHHLQSIGRS